MELQKLVRLFNALPSSPHISPELFRLFNRLPRSLDTLFSPIENHWQFAVHEMPVGPVCDTLFFTYPPSGYVHSEGSIQSLVGKSADESADIIVPMI
ncbi:hypothetical protein IFR05_009699 [Cadophora sp. M221]|nr:hypothetical protein IFR05_009699 [Cadophora sp. M221]